MIMNRAPSQVVNKHKKQASCIWVLLLGLIAGYIIWLLHSIYEKRENPEATLQLQVCQGSLLYGTHGYSAACSLGGLSDNLVLV